MNCAIRIKHYVSGYERIVGLSDYNSWRRVEKRIGRPVFQVMGIIFDRQYIDIKQVVDNYCHLIAEKEEIQ